MTVKGVDGVDKLREPIPFRQEVAAADAINEVHRLAQESAEIAMDYAISCGRLLMEKKKTLRHGEWIPWIQQNCEFDRFLAAKYMKAANVALTTHLDKAGKLALSREIWGNKDNHRTKGTGENEWYTPAEYVKAARKVLGSIELDPASSDTAQETVKAERYFTADVDGLAQAWRADTVFLNPPYSQPAIWDFIDRLVLELIQGNVGSAILLTHNYTDTAWFHRAGEVASAICFTRGRIKFVDADGNKCAPTQGQAFFYFGDNERVFAEEFSAFGLILTVRDD